MSGAAPDTAMIEDSPAVRRSNVRQDITDLIRLIRFVEGRREIVAAAGGGTAVVDDLARTLRLELAAVLRYRRLAPLPASRCAAARGEGVKRET